MRHSLFPLLVGNALLVLGTGLQSVLLPVRARLEGYTDRMLGLLGAGYYLGFVLGCLAVPFLVRRVGHSRAFTVLAVVAAETFPWHAALLSWPAWVGLRAVTGVCLAGLSMVIESWINETSANAERGRMLATYLVVTACATMAGQSMLHLADPATVTGFLLVALCIGLSLVPLTVSAAPVPRRRSRVWPDLGRLYRTSPAAAAGCLSVGLINGAFWSLVPAVLQSHGATAGRVATFMSIAVAGGALAQWPVGRVADRCDRRWVMLAACGGALLVGLPLGLMHGLPWAAQLALAAAFGAASFPLYALSAAHANDHAEPDEFVQTSGGLLLAFGVGAVVGPLVAAWAMAAAEGGLFLFTAVVHLGLAIFVAHRMTLRGPPHTKEAPAASPEGGQAEPVLSPRSVSGFRVTCRIGGGDKW